MDTPRRWINYDTFKLIIALLLLIILLLLLFRAPQTPAVAGIASATPAVAPPTATPQPVEAPTDTPSPQPSPTPTPLPPPTATTEAQATPSEAVSPTPQPQSVTADCPLALPARLEVGMQARVNSNLNLRSSPGIENNWLRTNPANTQLEVIGGPVCLPHNGGAYLWWNVQSPDGAAGWSAEGSLTGGSYFLEPVP